jgi:C4-dicarboxylate transporter DctM subunit
MTEVPLESVALKLFTGIEKFEIMAIPFFILAGNFLTHGGVAKRMINFATSMVGHWYGGLGLAGVLACALFAAVSGSSPATVVAIGSILLPAMVGRVSQQVRRGHHHHRRRAGHPDPAVHRDGDVLGGHQHLGRRAVHGRRGAGPGPGGNPRRRHLVPGAQVRLPAPAQGILAERVKAFRESVWGLLLIVVVMGGIYTGIFTPTEAAAMSAMYAFIVAVLFTRTCR